jgi:hypothetical protein
VIYLCIPEVPSLHIVSALLFSEFMAGKFPTAS